MFSKLVLMIIVLHFISANRKLHCLKYNNYYKIQISDHYYRKYKRLFRNRNLSYYINF